jgi:hypothetical protein
LSDHLAPGAVASARRELLVRIVRLPAGPWDMDRLHRVASGHIGLLVVDGIVGRELLAENVTSLELLGRGELVRPWQEGDGADLLRAVVRWSVLAEARLAILDRRVAVALGRYPELYEVLLERSTARAQRLAVTQAIAQINRVDRRVITMLWHLAERWGRVTPQGVHLPLVLSHRMLADMIGARRPTVSSALGELTRCGDVERRPDGTWLLTGSPVGAPDARVRRVIPRRQLLRRGASGHEEADQRKPVAVGRGVNGLAARSPDGSSWL